MKKNLLNHFIAGCNILLCLLLAGSVSQPLSAQQTYSFTTCGATGRYGPTQTQVNSTYTGTNTLNGQVTVSGQGIQVWNVPGAGAYKIETWGASGGPAGTYPANWGKGASMEGTFTLTAGQTSLKIIVGQAGQGSPAGGSGGGGSWVVDNNNVPLIVSGGGSGGGGYANPVATIMDGRITNYGANYQSTGRNIAGGGGGSFAVSGLNQNGGSSFLAGGVGGDLGGANGGYGGFGGGGGSSGSNALAAGAGGYSGGDEMYGYQVYQAAEGGGGSYNSGSNQVNVPGINVGDGKVIITRLCNVTLVASKNPICQGESITLSTNAVGGIVWSNNPSTGPSIIVSPTSNTTYTLTGQAVSGCTTSLAMSIIVNPLPALSAIVNPSVLCIGSVATVTAYGANSYTWSATNAIGNTTTVNPTVNSAFTYSGTNQYGCVSSTLVSVVVNTNVLGATANTTVCKGSSINLTATGAQTYTWSNGPMFATTPVSPTISTTYTVLGRDIHNCVLSKVVSVTVNDPPLVVATANKTLVCKGENVTITGTGADTYTWSTGFVGASLSTTLPVDIPYYFSVTGADLVGCKKTVNITIQVAKCLGINEVNNSGLLVNVLPNPGPGLFSVQVEKVIDHLNMKVYNELGMLVKTQEIVSTESKLDLQNEKSGIYFVRISDKNNVLKVIKLIKE